MREATIYRWSLGFGVLAYLTSLTAWLSLAVKVSFSPPAPIKVTLPKAGFEKSLEGS